MAVWRINQDTNLIPFLISELDKATEMEEFWRFLTDFGDIGPPSRVAFPSMIGAIKKSVRLPEAKLPFYAGEALRKIDPEEAGALLIELVADPNTRIRLAAIEVEPVEKSETSRPK
jgi:hypothetical protein